MRRSADPVRALAIIWAAKEAAYKLQSRRLAECHFVPRHFVTQIETHDHACFDKKLSVLYSGLQTQVSIFAEERWIHAVAAAPAMKVYWKVCEIKEGFVGGQKASSESEAVRFLANSLLEELGLRDLRLQFEGRIPRVKHKGGEDAGVDVSLAHHGAFAAAAVGWPSSLPVAQPKASADLAEIKASEVVCSTCIA